MHGVSFDTKVDNGSIIDNVLISTLGEDRSHLQFLRISLPFFENRSSTIFLLFVSLRDSEKNTRPRVKISFQRRNNGLYLTWIRSRWGGRSMIEIINFINLYSRDHRMCVIQRRFTFSPEELALSFGRDPPLLSFSCLYQYISIFRCRRIAVLSRSWRYFIRRYVKRAIKELVGLVYQTLISCTRNKSQCFRI